MSTTQVQGDLWGAQADDWMELGEPTSRPAFEAVLSGAGVGPGTRLLDVGCGAGLALLMARERGAEVAGLDVSPGLVEAARRRLPGARIEVGGIEQLPFESDSFDVVTGFNAFQFSKDIVAGLREARRVCRPGGSVAMCVWGLREECQSVAATIGAVTTLMPPPPPSPRPPLGTPGVIEGLMQEAGLTAVSAQDVDVPFDFPDAATAWRCFASAGPVVGAVRKLGEEPVKRAVMESLPPFTRADGSVHQKNRFHWVLGRKA